MKKLSLIILSLIFIIISAVNFQAATKSSFECCNDDLLFYADNNGSYIVSFNNTKAVINLIGNSYATVKCSYEIKKCQYSKGNFYFFYKTSDYTLGVLKYNYNNGKSSNILLNSKEHLNIKTASVDNNGEFYVASNVNKYKLFSFTSDGVIKETFSLDHNVLESDSLNGNYIVLKTAGGIYYIRSGVLYFLQDSYYTTSIKMISNDCFVYGGEIISLIYNYKYEYYKDRVAVINKGVVYADKSVLYFSSSTKGEATKKYQMTSSLDYLFGYGDKVFAVIDSNVYTINYKEFSKISSDDNATDNTDNSNVSSDNYGINSDYYIINDSYIMNVMPSTSVSNFKSFISYGDYDLDIYEGEYYVPRGNVATGMTASFTGAGTVNKTIIVKGDLNCDGKANSKDIKQMMQYLIGKTTLEGNSRLSADVIKDNKFDNKDLVAMAQLAK